ncbi:MAG: hypothetical protein CMN30_08610 [Sandaracinus sp.]|nr:hypothetical protein [Sandaracinus sp.]
MGARAFLKLFSVLALVISCGEVPPAADVGFSIATLDMSPPDDLVCVSLSRSDEGGMPIALFVRNLESIDDPDDDGSKELVVDTLPTYGTPFELIIEGFTTENCAGSAQYVGRSGQIRLQAGERRVIEMALYEAQQAEALRRGEAPPSGMFPTATTLPDGRVLVAGGFTDLEDTDCPATAPTATCFIGTATSDAWIFDPAAGRFHPVQGGMMAARAGHTATLLEDGRVLIAGGAPGMRMAIIPGADGAAASFVIEPYAEDADEAALASFEIFEPEANPEVEDLDRNGDPGRGGFVGRADDLETVGLLNRPRFLHAAARTGEGTVVLAGGMGDLAAQTYEVFDPARPGGYGVYDNTGANLQVARVLPSAVALETEDGESRVLIVGGIFAMNNDQLAEVWAPDEESLSGVTTPATDLPGFPTEAAEGVKEDRPRFSLLRPQVAPLDGGSTALVSGWYGPRCPSATEQPAFDGAVMCPKTTGSFFRNYTVNIDTGATVDWQASSSRFQSFGATAVLLDGRVVVSGGIQDGQAITTNYLSIYRPSTSADTGRPVAFGANATLAPRAFHAATGLRGGGVFVFGGVSITSGTTVRLADISGEAFFL